MWSDTSKSEAQLPRELAALRKHEECHCALQCTLIVPSALGLAVIHDITWVETNVLMRKVSEPVYTRTSVVHSPRYNNEGRHFKL